MVCKADLSETELTAEKLLGQYNCPEGTQSAKLRKDLLTQWTKLPNVLLFTFQRPYKQVRK